MRALLAYALPLTLYLSTATITFLLYAEPSLAHAGANVGSGAGLLSLLVYIVIIGLIFYAIWWFIGYAGVPEPFNKVIRVIVGLVALIIIINLLLGMMGTPMFRF